MTAPPWWQSAVIYQVYPRSFCDSDGDGVGDLEGVRRHLDHLVRLGVDAVWLSPFYRSPMADFGYDVADYTDVDPLFGSLETIDALIADAHAAGLKVLVDWVPNHTSDQHPWFRAARASRDDPMRDWYWWRDDRDDASGGTGPPGSPGRRPNRWLAAFAGVDGRELPPAWTWDEATEQWYLHLFLPEQPDLNWAHPEVRRAMEETLTFWMERGVDGFRVDVAHGLGKDPMLPERGGDDACRPAASVNDDPSTHPILAGLRRVIDDWPDPPRIMVGEVFLPTTAQVARYLGTPAYPELHLAFNFPPMFAPWQADAWRTCVDEAESRLAPVGGWPTWVLSNHDTPRHRTRYGSEDRARAAAVLLLTLRGTPFLYAGEEIGLADAEVPSGRRLDPGGRDGCRAPIPWTDDEGHGWAGGHRVWLPWPPGAEEGRTVAGAEDDAASMLGLYRRLLRARKASAALTSGTFGWVASGRGVLAYERRSGDERRVVAVNFTDGAEWFVPPGEAVTVEVSSDGVGEGAALPPAARRGALALGPNQAVILRP